MALRGKVTAVGALPAAAVAMIGIRKGLIRRSFTLGAVLTALAASAFLAVRPASEAIGPETLPTLRAGAPAPDVNRTVIPFAPVIPPRASVLVRADTTAALVDVFDRHSYRLAGVQRFGTVPRLFVASLPRDLRTVTEAAERKALFIRIILPLVLAVNGTIAANRARIERLRSRLVEEQPLTIEQEGWLAEMFIRHDVPMFDFAELLRRVDVIAPSLAIAQSAEESGWGTSRFARTANALFGQRIFKGGKGLVPRAREAGARYRVRAFDRLMDAVRAYAANLNAHPAYARFRSARADLRRRNRPLDGLALAKTMRMYSERRDAYVATITRIIRTNRLTVFDDVRLGGAAADLVLESED